jgi:ABC-type multidrug transport system ATPase subunit
MQLTVENLSKNYRGGVQALRNVQLSLQPDVLGPNGAGKSALMRILVAAFLASACATSARELQSV